MKGLWSIDMTCYFRCNFEQNRKPAKEKTNSILIILYGLIIDISSDF